MYNPLLSVGVLMSNGLFARTDPHTVQGPKRITYGLGSADELSSFVNRHTPSNNDTLERVLVVTDGDLVEVGVTDIVVDTLSAAGVDVEIFDGVAPEPTLTMAEDAAAVLRDRGAEAVVGVGGGSVLDTAKFASVLAAYETPTREMLGMGNVPGPGKPTALLPTTAGTGSEVTHIGVFTDPEDGGTKRVVYSEHLFVDLAIIDPELTRSLPKRVAAATGLDALTHAVESYVTVLRTPYSDMLAERAIELIADNLRGAVHQGEHNDRARYNMSLAATMAGQAFVNSGLGAVHALTYPLSIRHGVGHGEANAMLLPHVMAYNVPAEPDRFADVAHLLGVGPDGSTVERAYAGVNAVFELIDDVGIPTSIGHLGELGDEELETFVDIAFEYSQHNIDRNPRSLDRADVKRIYENAR